MYIILGFIVWVACGYLAGGLVNAEWADEFGVSCVKKDLAVFRRLLILIGPAGLIAALIIAGFRMPIYPK